MPASSSNLKPKTARWTLEKISDGLEKFHKEFNRYPTSTEIDAFPYLPSSRQIQRVYGGLVELRKQLKLKGQHDFTEGAYSSERATLINERAFKVEKEVYTYLVGTYGEPYVHREYFFTDDRRTRTDFFVFYKGGNFSVDVFYPKDRHNLIGCINSKMRAYNGRINITYPVIFLMMNEKISQEVIDSVLQNKEKKLYPYQKMMAMEEFKEFCKGRKAL